MSEFFESPPPPRIVFEFLPPKDWMNPPQGVLPAVVRIEQVVASSEDVAVYVDNLWAYPTGFELDLFAVARAGDRRFSPFDVEHDLKAEREGAIPPEKLRVGLEFADGSSATNIRDHEQWEDDLTPKPPKMHVVSGLSSEDEWETSYWVWPFPPPGPLTLVCEWPAAGIPLTRTELDSQAIIDAAARAQAPFESD